MYGQKFLCFSALMVYLGIIHVYADGHGMAMDPDIKKCIDDLGINREDVWAAKKAGNVDAINPCYFACFFKHVGVIDSKGMFDLDKALEFGKQTVKDPNVLAAFEKSVKECASVNDEKVDDGEKGCERSRILFKCYSQKKQDMLKDEQ